MGTDTTTNYYNFLKPAYSESDVDLDKVLQRKRKKKKKRKRHSKTSCQNSENCANNIELKKKQYKLKQDEYFLQENTNNSVNSELSDEQSSTVKSQKKCLEYPCNETTHVSSNTKEHFSSKVKKHRRKSALKSQQLENGNVSSEILTEVVSSPCYKTENANSPSREEHNVAGIQQHDTIQKKHKKTSPPCKSLSEDRDSLTEDKWESDFVPDIDVSNFELDLTEVPLKFIPPKLHVVGRVSVLKPDQKRDLEDIGIVIRTGKWTKKEDNILIRNWERFTKKFKVTDPLLLLGIHQGRRRQLRKFIIAKKFYQRLAKDLNDRTIFSVYSRARKLFNPYNLDRNLTNEEVSQLFKLHNKYGSDWIRIGKIMNLSAPKCAEAIRWHMRKTARGHWATAEEEKLIESLQDVLGTEDLNGAFRGLPWEKIARNVSTRNCTQCRKHWLHTLCWKVSHDTPRQKWNDKYSACLIYLLYHEAPEEECTIDWDALYERFKTIAPSYAFLRNKYDILRVRVPDYCDKDYEDIILYLYHFHLPRLLKKLNMTHEELKEFINEYHS